jgi:signal transduction histidine kinase
VEGRGGMQIEFQVQGASLEPRVPFGVQEELYQIAREALNNVLKHAQARHVGIHLQFKESCTNLLVFDDGIGFDLSQAREGGRMGLSGMQERADKIGATLQIESTPGQGARVIVTVPTLLGTPETMIEEAP